MLSCAVVRAISIQWLQAVQHYSTTTSGSYQRLHRQCGWGYGFGQGKSDGLVATVYPVRDVSSSMMMYSHICDMTAASALQERTYSSLNVYKSYLTKLFHFIQICPSKNVVDGKWRLDDL
jgi:hypothetical protein